jgi:hypothetical protein
MSKNPFWNSFVLGFKGPNYWRQQIEIEKRNQEISDKLKFVKSFLYEIMQNDGYECSTEMLQSQIYIDELIEMHPCEGV